MAPTKAEVLKNKRSSYWDQLQRVELFIEDIDEVAAAGFEGLQLRLRSLEKLSTNFESIQSELEGYAYDKDTAEVRQHFESLYFKVHPALSRLCNSVKPDEIIVASHQNNSGQPNHFIRLPDLGLPTFSGDTVKWMSFIEQFNATVHRKPGLSDAEKFQYLLLALKGPALKIIESIEISDNNYNVAVALLKERYDNKHLIVQEHIRQLFNIKPVDRNSSRDLREIIDNTRAHIRALQSLGRPVDKWDDIIIYLLETKLDFYTVARWQEEAPTNRFPTVDDLFATLNRRCQVLENTARTSAGPFNFKQQQPSTGNQNKGSHRRRSSLSVASSTTNNPRHQKCVYCGDGPTNHNIYRCDRFAKLTPADRINEIKRLKVCVNCLKSGHFSSTCNVSPSGCKICTMGHHTLLHIPSDADASGSSNYKNESSSCTPATSMSCMLAAEPNVVQLKSFGESNLQNNHVFLATAVVIAVNRSGHTFSCRVLLDSGSQLNFITERLAHHLQLAREKSDVSVMGVGGRKLLYDIEHF